MNAVEQEVDRVAQCRHVRYDGLVGGTCIQEHRGAGSAERKERLLRLSLSAIRKEGKMSAEDARGVLAMAEDMLADELLTQMQPCGAIQEKLGDLERLNERLHQDATNLSQALTSNVKAQGNWGEQQLERLLEICGLHKGQEYSTQFSVTTEGGQRHAEHDHERVQEVLE